MDKGAPVTRPGPIGPLSERALFLKPLTSRCEGVADFNLIFIGLIHLSKFLNREMEQLGHLAKFISELSEME